MLTLGKNLKITAPETARPQARAVFEVLGAKLATPEPGFDVFAVDGGNIGFEYVPEAEALTAAQMQRATWIELCVDNVATTRDQLVAIGVPRLDYRDKEHPYFVGPGGIVFRLAALAPR